MPDLSKLSDEDLIALSSGDMSKLSDEGLGLLLANTIEQPVEQSTSPSATDKVAALGTGFGDVATMGYLPQLQAGVGVALDKGASALAKLGIGPYAQREKMKQQGLEVQSPDMSYVAQRDRAIAENKAMIEKAPGYGTAGKVLGAGASMLLPGGGAKTLLGKVGQGAVQGALYNPGDVEGVVDPMQAAERAKGAAIGGGMTVGMAGVGQGLKWAGQRIMRHATGMRPTKTLNSAQVNELAQEALDQNLVGTKNMMINQARAKGEMAEKALNQTLESIDVPVSSEKVASGIGNIKNKFTTRMGNIPEDKLDDIALIEKRANEVAARGDIPATEAIDYARIAERGGYTLEDKAKGLKPSIGRAEGTGYKDILKEMSPDVANKLKTEQAMIVAQKALQKANRGPDLVSLLTGKFSVLPTALPASVAAQALSKTSKPIDPLTRLLRPATLEGVREE